MLASSDADPVPPDPDTMSFFDDDDEPTRAAPRARPRRTGSTAAVPGGTSSRTSPRPPGGGGRTPDDQQLLIRRLVAAGLFVLFFAVVVLLLRSCASNRKENALKDFNRGVVSLGADSRDQVTRPLFQALNAGTSQAADLETQVNELRTVADRQVERARDLDARDEVKRARDNLVLVMNLRAGALDKIGGLLRNALVEGQDNAQTAEDAVTRIAGQMRAFDASDVIFSQRVVPEISGALADADISGQPVPRSASLPDVGWLSVDRIAGVLNTQRPEGGQGADPNPAPGLHGHGLTSVAVGSTTLQGGETVNRVRAGTSPTFAVAFQNQGDNSERDVTVQVRVTGTTFKTISAKKAVAQTTSKQPATVSIPISRVPPATASAIVEVVIDKVPGEENTTNNRGRFIVVFGR